MILPPKTYVYRNLHKKCWSLMRRGIVQEHRKDAYLVDCVFRVRKAGRLKVLQTKKKHVHAFVVGSLMKPKKFFTINNDWEEIKYNPYHHGYFYSLKTDNPVFKAREVWMNDGKVWALI